MYARICDVIAEVRIFFQHFIKITIIFKRHTTIRQHKIRKSQKISRTFPKITFYRKRRIHFRYSPILHQIANTQKRRARTAVNFITLLLCF